MVIQHNLTALNASNQFYINNHFLQKSSERLSSGYRINRAADDAAGLQISEKFRSQIRGLRQASDNLVDGISLVRIADGAMAEIQDMIHRMKELGVKASNGTLTDFDRESVQTETAHLIEEIDRIAASTEFNTIHLLDNTYNHGRSGKAHSLSQLLSGKITTSPHLGDVMTLGSNWVTTGNTNPSVAGNGNTGSAAAPNTNLAAAYLDFSELGTKYSLQDLIGSGFNSTCQTCSQHYSIYFLDKQGQGHKQSYSNGNHPVLEFDIGVLSPSASGADLVKALMDAFNAPGSVMGKHYTQYAYDPTDPTRLYVYDNRKNYTYTDPVTGEIKSKATNASFDPIAYGMPAIDPKIRFPFSVQSGPSADQYISFLLPWVTSDQLFATAIDMSTQAGARQSLSVIDDASAYLSSERSRMGAEQNRMEHALSNVDNATENQEAAESRLRDADMAKEMLTHSKYSILQQTVQAMLSHANSNPEGILKLLT